MQSVCMCIFMCFNYPQNIKEVILTTSTVQTEQGHTQTACQKAADIILNGGR